MQVWLLNLILFDIIEDIFFFDILGELSVDSPMLTASYSSTKEVPVFEGPTFLHLTSSIEPIDTKLSKLLADFDLLKGETLVTGDWLK